MGQIDNEIVLRLRNSDIEAFNILYWKFHAAIYANALKLIGNPILAEDIVQEVFITLWERRDTMDPDQDISGWLFKVSYNKSIDQLKRTLRNSMALENSQVFTDASTDVNKDIIDARLNTLEKAMQQLSPQKRKVFELCKIQGKTYEKAAQELKISKHTVKEYLSEALTIIKKYIVQHPEHQCMLICICALPAYL